MSDDDCDIFQMPAKTAMPQMQAMHVVQDNESQPDEYDFIDSKVNKKSANPANKPEQAKHKSKAAHGKHKKQQENEEKLSNNNMSDLENGQSHSTRASLSPVSQMISEMEEQQGKIEAMKREALPVARRTRSSMGKSQQTSKELLPVAPSVGSAPKKRAGRGRKARASLPAKEAITVSRSPPTRTRTEAAATAARSQVVDSIDLVSAVVPRVEGFVNLDTDDETAACDDVDEPTPAESTWDDDNPIIDINLNWLGEMQFYKLRRHQKFLHMFKEVSERNGVSVDSVEITMNDNVLNAKESPDSVGLKGYFILSGYAKVGSQKNPSQKNDLNPLSKSKKFQLRVQSDKWKHPFIVQMKKTETFKLLYIKCAEETDCNVQDFKLFFDGELLEMDDTPQSLEMEGNEIIDYHLK